MKNRLVSSKPITVVILDFISRRVSRKFLVFLVLTYFVYNGSTAKEMVEFFATYLLIRYSRPF